MRRENDAYYTTATLAQYLVDTLALRDLPVWGLVLEPSVGAGAFAHAICNHKGTVMGVDIDAQAPGFSACEVHRVGDFLTQDIPSLFDMVVGNPPFSDAEAHVKKMLTLAPYVAVLLRLGFLASQTRSEFWATCPGGHLYVLSKRPSFTNGGTDRYDYGFYVFDHNKPSGMWTFSHLDNP